MKLVDLTAFTGPSIFSERPHVRLVVDPGGAEPLAVEDLLGYAARRLPEDNPWPQLRRSLGESRESGATADWMSLLGALAVAFQEDRFDGRLGHRSETPPEAAVSSVVVETNEPPVGRLAALFAFQVVDHLFSPPGEAEAEKAVSRLAQDSRRFLRARARMRYDDNSRVIAESAMKHGVPLARPMREVGIMFLGQGHRLRRMHELLGDSTSVVACHMASDKRVTAHALAAVGIPVPEQRVVRSTRELQEAVAEIGFPLVIKGRTGSQGTSVTTNIRSISAIGPALEKARRVSAEAIVEKHIEGDDYRMTVIDGRMVAAARRQAAQVVGDGRRSVRALVERENERRRNAGRHAHWIVPLAIDDDSERMLADAGLAPDSVPAAEQRVRLRSAGSFSRGGIAEDVTEDVHPEVVQAVERAARTIGLDMAGIDLLTPDITRPLAEAGGAINEVNQGPAARAHYITPTPSPDVAAAVVDYLFPAPERGRIPTVAVTGVDSATTCRLVARALEAAGDVVAIATRTGMSVGREALRAGDCANGRAAQFLLQDRRVRAGVFEMSPRSLLRHGLCWDSCDIGVVESVAVQRNDRDTELVARAQRLPIEAARRAAILNAEAEHCVVMARHASAPLWWVSPRGSAADLDARIADGGHVILLQSVDGVPTVVHRVGDETTAVLPLPGAASRGDVEATLFAVAVALALGQDRDRIAAALA